MDKIGCIGWAIILVALSLVIAIVAATGPIGLLAILFMPVVFSLAKKQ